MTLVGSLARIVLVCRDAERLAAFYADAFGFAYIDAAPKPDAGLAALFGLDHGQLLTKRLRLGEQTVALVQPYPLGRSYPDDVAGWDPLFQHFALVVSAMPAAYARLRAVGGWTAISAGGPQQLPAASSGVTAFKFRDPEGHPLELLAYGKNAAPPPWTPPSAALFLGIDHSAISVADTARSVAFYEGLGLRRKAASLNTGVEQDKLDDIARTHVEVTAMAPVLRGTPHVELLCYRGRFDRRDRLAEPPDIAATELVFAVETADALDALCRTHRAAVVSGPVRHGGATSLLIRDPDGHLLRFETALANAGAV